MNQCLRAAEAMFNMSIPPPTISPLKRKSFSEMGDHPSKKQAVGSPGDASPYGLPRNVNTQSPGVALPVNIQPRPNGFPAANAPTNTPDPISQNVVLPPRRRGRPPKAETLARQGLAQPAHYPPISPAPIAPSPAQQAIAPRHQSPAPAYHWSPTTAARDTKPKKKGRQSGGDKQPSPPESVPRTLHPAHHAEADPRHDMRPASSGQRSTGEHSDWRETVSGPTHPQGSGRRETQLPPMQTLPPPPLSPQPPLERGPQTREPPPTSTTGLDQARHGGHAGTVN